MTWDEMVEIAAKARYEAWVKSIGLSALPKWSDLHPTVRDDFYETENAALTALREAGVRFMPEVATEEMLGAAFHSQQAATSYVCGVIYTAMLSAGEIKPEGGK
jgi:hypothetical protein